MTTLTRKQREIRDREKLILDVARDMLVDQGYLGMTMDKIAEATEYSKGTIYQHFSCKEEVLAALAIQTGDIRAELFERAATFRGQPRERIMAIGVANDVFCRLHADHFRCEQVVHTSSIRSKTSAERQATMAGCEAHCLTTVTGIIRDGIAHGDLVLPADTTPESLCFGLWSMSFGTHAILAMDIPLTERGIVAPLEILARNSQALLDGYLWKPLTHEWDYAATLERIQSEVFPAELARLVSL